MQGSKNLFKSEPWWVRPNHIEIRDNKLIFAGKDIESISKEYGTPLYLYNSSRIKFKYQSLKNNLQKYSNKDFNILFACKANHLKQLLEIMAKEGVGADVSSPYEAQLAIMAGFKKNNILFTSSFPSYKDLKAILDLGLLINIDSESSFNKVLALGGQEISLRFNPGMGASYMPCLLGSGKCTPAQPIKFGINKTQLISLAKRAQRKGIRIMGLHQHIGSGWAMDELEIIISSIRAICELSNEISDITGRPLEFINFGGGMNIRKAAIQNEVDIKIFIQRLCEITNNINSFKEIRLEPGTFLIGDSAILLTQITAIEKKNGINILGVDSGFNIFGDPALYQIQHEIILNKGFRSNKNQKYTIGGNLLESRDFFTYNIDLPNPSIDDLIVILFTGAYGSSMSSNYHLRPKAAEVIIDGDSVILARKRQGFEDLVP